MKTQRRYSDRREEPPSTQGTYVIGISRAWTHTLQPEEIGRVKGSTSLLRTVQELLITAASILEKSSIKLW